MDRIRPLEMRWHEERAPDPRPAPVGYTCAHRVDRGAFETLQASAGWRMRAAQWDDLLGALLPGGMIFCADRRGSDVAVACVTEAGAWAELGWVAVIPEHRGRGLGRVVSAAATAAANALGRTDLRLTTQDHRLSAIKTYLNLGWLPHPNPATEGRWRDVMERLGPAPESGSDNGHDTAPAS